jgi:hypothetical protein
MGNRQGRSATILVLAGLLLIGTPTVMLSGSFASQIQQSYTEFENGTLTLSPPKESVAEWPIVGERVYTAWKSASSDLPAYVHTHRDELKKLAERALAAAARGPAPSTATRWISALGSVFRMRAMTESMSCTRRANTVWL